MGELKRLGCCTVCDEPIFEVTTRWMEGPYKGEARQLGRALPGIRRVTVVRMSGRQSYWSLCPTCEIDPKDMVVLNRKEIRAMVKERSLSKDNPAQAENREKMLRLFEWDVPLGVLGEKPWSEVV